jgi:1-hydroxycarotenoid 3,4-desaturase
MNSGPRVVVVGAGVGGLVAAGLLAARGHGVTLVEAQPRVGGKLAEVELAGRRLDAGPTVFTMRPVFEALFEALGARLADHLSLTPARVLARHAWDERSRLDLPADPAAAVDAIGRFSGAAEARRYAAFCERARRIHDALERPYLQASRPGLLQLMWRAGWRGLPGLAGISPFARLWDELGRSFRDPRLQQLFGRYATYCGSSPMQAPATLMLIAHVEQQGVWFVDGGMRRLADALAELARLRGVHIRCGTAVATIEAPRGAVEGVTLADGERLAADAVVFNGDAAALADGLLGEPARRVLRRRPPRSYSAVTWHELADVGDFPLHHHTVFFGADYPAEFRALAAGRLPEDPTVYLCAQDRTDQARGPGPERLMALVNAPAHPGLAAEEIDRCRQASLSRLQRCGLRAVPITPPQTTTPAEFARRFPGTDGALYGRPTHGWRASFQRGGSTTPLRGLYLAGGSVHPGPGVPMAALSGRLAADRLSADLASTRRWHATAMPGGTSTPSATTDATR